MPEHLDYRNDDLFNPETHHESSDVPTRPLFWAMVFFAAFSVVSAFLVLFLYKAFANGERNAGEPPMTSLARPANADVPQNQPLLQPFPKKDQHDEALAPNGNTPVTDLQDMRRSEDAILHSYGYVDKQQGLVRIPIDQAKDLVLGRLAQTPVVAAPVSPVAPDTGAIPAPATTPATTTTATTTTGGAHP
jgi:hypothetical protein